MREWSKKDLQNLYTYLMLNGNNLFVACALSGDFITPVESIQEGLKMIDEFETQDKIDGIYEPNFYEIENKEHQKVNY